MRVLLTPEDHAIVAVPNYQAAETLPLEICDVTGVPLQGDMDWLLDLDALAASDPAKHKLVSVNFPNNPTGAIIPRADFDALVGLCRNTVSISSATKSIACSKSTRPSDCPRRRMPMRRISLNVMSKAYGLPGLRIGWLASQDTDLLLRLERYKHYLSICNSAPSERLAVIGLRARDQILERNRGLVRDNLSALDEFFADYPALFEWSHPDGGCVAYPKFLGRGGAEAFCHDLVEENGVLLLPASIYRSNSWKRPPTGSASASAGATLRRVSPRCAGSSNGGITTSPHRACYLPAA